MASAFNPVPPSTGTTYTSPHSNQKVGPYTPADAQKPVEELLGNSFDPIGLKDFTGDPRYQQRKGVRMVMAADAKAALDAAMDDISNTPIDTLYEIYGKSNVESWPKNANGKPQLPLGFNDTARTKGEQTYQYETKPKGVAAKPGNSKHETGTAGDVAINDPRCFPNERAKKFFQQKMYDRGFRQLKEEGTSTYTDEAGRELPRVVKKGEAQHFAYEKGPSQAERYQHLTKTGDIERLDRNDRSRKYNAGNPDDAKYSYLGKDHILTSSMSAVDRANAAYSARKSGTVDIVSPTVAKDILTAAYNGQPVATIKVEELPSNTGPDAFSEVEDNLRRNRASGFRDKRDKNVFNMQAPLGYNSKIDVPAQMQIVVDKVTSGNDKSAQLSTYERSEIQYIDCFILKSARVVHDEKSFVFQALNGDAVTFFFGNKPSVYNFSGVLMDTYNQQWFNDFEFFYKNYLRGSASIKNKTRVFMMYKDQVIEGFMLNVQMGGDADTNDIVTFSFDFILVQKTEVGGYQNPLDRRIATSRATEGASSAKAGGGMSGSSADTSKAKHNAFLNAQASGTSVMASGDFWKKGLNAKPSLDPSEVTKLVPPPITPPRPVHAGTPKGPTSDYSNPASVVRDELYDIGSHPEKNPAVKVDLT